MRKIVGIGETVLDINFRKSHLRDLRDTFENIQENCRLSDVVRGSSEDFGYLFGTTSPVEIYDKHTDFCFIEYLNLMFPLTQKKDATDVKPMCLISTYI